MIPPDTAEDADTFGGRLRAARRRLRTANGERWGQAELALAVGVERNTVSRWENANIRPRDPAMVAKLAEVLNVSVSWLLEGFGQAGGAPAGGRTELRDGASSAGRYAAAGASELPPTVRTLIAEYIRRVAIAGGSAAQVAGAEVLLLAGAQNEIASLPVAARSEGDVAADVDAAWDCVVRILRRDGIRP